jgi:hypothetical protein
MPVGDAIRGIIGTENFMDVTDNTDLITTDFVNAMESTRSFFCCPQSEFCISQAFPQLNCCSATTVPQSQFFSYPQFYQTKFSFMPVRTLSRLNLFHWNHHTCLHFLSVQKLSPAGLKYSPWHWDQFLSSATYSSPSRPNISSGVNFPASVFAVFYGTLLLSFEVCERQHLFDNPLNFIHDWSRGGYRTSRTE